MPMLQTLLGKLNKAFGEERIADLAKNKDAFAPGRPFVSGIIVTSGMPLRKSWADYLNQIPEGIQKAIQATMYHALSTEPPRS